MLLVLYALILTLFEYKICDEYSYNNMSPRIIQNNKKRHFRMATTYKLVSTKGFTKKCCNDTCGIKQGEKSVPNVTLTNQNVLKSVKSHCLVMAV